MSRCDTLCLPLQPPTPFPVPTSCFALAESVAGWLMDGAVQRLVLVITGVDCKQPLERWCFTLDSETHKGVNGVTYAVARRANRTGADLTDAACGRSLRRKS